MEKYFVKSVGTLESHASWIAYIVSYVQININLLCKILMNCVIVLDNSCFFLCPFFVSRKWLVNHFCINICLDFTRAKQTLQPSCSIPEMQEEVTMEPI